MRKGWEIKNLGEVVEVLDNLRKPITKKHRVEGVYPYYGATGILSYVHEYIFDERLILIGEDGAKWKSGDNTAFIAEGKYWVNNHAHAVRSVSQKVIDNWIVYYLNFSDLTSFITGMTVPKLNQEKMRSIPIPIPPLSEQQEIVSILDHAFESIERAKSNAEQNLKNAKELLKSYIVDIFQNGNSKWELKTLNTISENLDSKRIPITKNVRSEGSIPYYGASGIVDYVAEYLFNEELLCVSEDGANLLARTYPIAYSISGKTWVNNHAHVLKFKDLDTQKFVEIFLNSIKLDDYVSGMAQPKLNQTMLNKISIPYPTLVEQKSIVNKIEMLSIETQKLEAIYQQKLNDLEELKNSILQKAFNGELKSNNLV